MGRKKLTEEEKLQRLMNKKNKKKFGEVKLEKSSRDKKSPFYKMANLHDSDYEYLQKRWERYLRNQVKIESFNNTPVGQRNISEYNDACNVVVNCKNLIIDFLSRYSTYQNVQFMKNKFHEIDRKGVPV